MTYKVVILLNGYSVPKSVSRMEMAIKKFDLRKHPKGETFYVIVHTWSSRVKFAVRCWVDSRKNSNEHMSNSHTITVFDNRGR